MREHGTRSAERKKSLIKIPSTSKIPRDFFRQPSSQKNPSAQKSKVPDSLEFTFMAAIKQPQLKTSLSEETKTKPGTAIKRVGRPAFEKSMSLAYSEA